MPDDDRFIAAIVERRDDKQLIAVYADWLEEQADPRSAFLRAQVAGAKPARLKFLARNLDATWLGKLNAGLRKGDRVRILAGEFEDMNATVMDVNQAAGEARILPEMFAIPLTLPSVSLADLIRLQP